MSRQVISLVHSLRSQEIGNKKLNQFYDKELSIKHMINNALYKEEFLNISNIDKIFCSYWFNDCLLLLGTKCNKLLAYNFKQKKVDFIPTKDYSSNIISAAQPRGIHSIAVNPSKTLIATGGNVLSVYHLPTLDYMYINEDAHSDIIFDILWLDDQFLISGSRDTTIAIFRLNENTDNRKNIQASVCLHAKQLHIKQCQTAEKIRALACNLQFKEVAALSLNAYIHLLDIETFTLKYSRHMPHYSETVCLAFHSSSNLYAVGSKSYVTLIDSRTMQTVLDITSSYHDVCIRSLKFEGNIMTIGTGQGHILFYDICNKNYLESFKSVTRDYYTLKAHSCWMLPNYTRYLANYSPAIYTQCYDPSGTRLFTGGGPLSVFLPGFYAAIWQ